MTTKLFKTKKLAEEYINGNYPPPIRTKRSVLENTHDWEAVDMPDFQWSGETPALSILDNDFNEIGCVAWWEEGDDKYILTVGGEDVGEYDNIYDAREAFNKAVEIEEGKDEEEEKVFEVKLFCNGEEITG